MKSLPVPWYFWNVIFM